MRIQVWSGATIKVLHNPTKVAFENFTKEHRAIRGLVTYDGKNLYVWDGAAAVHSNMIQELGLEHIDCVAFNDGRWSGAVSDDGGYRYKEAIERVTPYKAPPEKFTDDELLKILNDPEWNELLDR